MKLGKLLIGILFVSILVLPGCGGSESQTTGQQNVTPKVKSSYTASEVLQAFKDAGLPLGRVEEYTAETDPNKLLGRPNQYAGKFNFEDTRYAKPESESLVGGSVEVFDSIDNLETRKAYIESVTKNASILQQYIYVHKNILLRIDFKLTPDQAKEYETVLNEL